MPMMDIEATELSYRKGALLILGGPEIHFFGGGNEDFEE